MSVVRRILPEIAAFAAFATSLAVVGCAPSPRPKTPAVLESPQQPSDIDYAQVYLNLGTEYYKAGRYADAIDQFKRSLEVNPYSDEAHASIGMAYYKLGKHDLAERSFRTALKLNPRNVLARNGLALMTQDDHERAQELEAAIKYNPDVPELRNNLCYTYAQGGNYAQAVTECQASIKLDSTNAYAHYNLGFAYQRQGRLDDALKEYESALRYHPDWARVLNNMGLVYYYKSEFSDAIKRYEQAISANGNEPTFQYNLALAYEAVASRLQTAKERKQPASGVYGADATADWHVLYRQAADALRSYLDLKPNAPDAQRIRAKINELRRRANEAR